MFKDSTSIITYLNVSGGGGSLPKNLGREIVNIQNFGVNPLLVKYGDHPVTTGNATAILKPGTSFYDGNGGVLVDSYYKGQVSVSGTNAVFVLWEM